MAEILLTSEAFVKSVTNISDNVAGKYILPSIREAQEVGLKGIVGSCLLSTLKQMVKDGTLGDDGNETYLELVQEAQYYLAYKAIVEVAYKVSYKFGNFGVAKSNDENLQVASAEEIDKMRYYYQSKADACCYDLQTWLLQHRADLPELTDACCCRIASNLRSAATCGIWLGGARGREKPEKCCKR